jgi:hypothetical protein
LPVHDDNEAISTDLAAAEVDALILLPAIAQD